MILLIDNYDSFSYNLYQLISQLDRDVKVVRNDKISIDEIYELNPDMIFISPGPGRPENAGICIDIIKEFYDKIPILGVCLGHQLICAAFGGEISYANKLIHGKSSKIKFNSDDPLFKNVDKDITVGRYHSLSLLENSLPSQLEIIAKSDDGEIMAVKHKLFPVYGLQFHPESILTQDGLQFMKNFMEIVI